MKFRKFFFYFYYYYLLVKKNIKRCIHRQYIYIYDHRDGILYIMRSHYLRFLVPNVTASLEYGWIWCDRLSNKSLWILFSLHSTKTGSVLNFQFDFIHQSQRLPIYILNCASISNGVYSHFNPHSVQFPV